MKKLLPVLCILLFSCTSPSGKQWQKIEQNFTTTPLKVRPNPLWFWNDSRVEPEVLTRQMNDFKTAGYGGLSILPFGKNFKPDYLSDEYFNIYKTSMDEAQKLGLTLWIYDEYGFPSGTAGDINGDGIGRFKQKYPEYTNKRLDKSEYIPNSKSIFELILPVDSLMAIIAMDTVLYKRIDLRSNISNGKLKWDVPEGKWKVFVFTCVDAGNTILDYMSPEAAGFYINMTHDQYYKHFSEYFGKTVVGTFFDEPTLYYAEGRSWTPDFNRKFQAKYGFSPDLYYPALWYDIGEETNEARNYLFGFRSDLYAEGYIKLVNEWSREHGILATGHQDNEEVVNCVGTSGDLMKCFKYLDIPGIDKIGGNRPAEKFYKIISSSAYNWDHSLVMSETYGAMGNISWNEIMSIAMDQYVKGINLLIPHAVWYDINKVVFKPELSLRNPIYADSLQAFTTYLARLNALMQNDARWMGDIAVLYPIETMQSGHYLDGPLGHYAGGVEIPGLDYVDVGVTLFDSLAYDFLFLHPEVLDEKCRVVANQLLLDNQIQHNRFSTLVLPGCKTISLSNLQKIQAFADAGGTVVFTTCLPQKASRVQDDQAIQAIIREMFTHNAQVVSYGRITETGKGKALFISNPDVKNMREAMEAVQIDNSLRFTGMDRVKNIRKILHGKNTWFFANPDMESKNVEFEVKGEYDLKVWDPHTGKVSDLSTGISCKEGKTKIQLKINAYSSLFLVEK